jgi:hypothetical protein
LADCASTESTNLLAGVVKLHVELVCVTQQCLPLRGQGHAAGQPVEQTAFERGFEAPHRLGEAGLRYSERLGGGAEAAVLGYGIEVAELGQVHDTHSPKLWEVPDV